MHTMRMALAAAVTFSIVLATSGTAFAQGTSIWETRADFILQLDRALGTQAVYPATPDFQDVSTSSPYYGYIEVAFQAAPLSWRLKATTLQAVAGRLQQKKRRTRGGPRMKNVWYTMPHVTLSGRHWCRSGGIACPPLLSLNG